MYASDKLGKIDDMTYLRIIRIAITIAVSLVIFFTAFSSLTVHASSWHSYIKYGSVGTGWYYKFEGIDRYYFKDEEVHSSSHEFDSSYNNLYPFIFVEDCGNYGRFYPWACFYDSSSDSYSTVKLKSINSPYSLVAGTPNPSNGYHHSLTTNIPVCMLPDSIQYYDMLAYMRNFVNGDTSGLLNGNDVDFDNSDFYDSAYNLENFTANNVVKASWTGVTERSKATEIEEVNEWVQLYIGYAYKKSPKQIATREEIKGKYPTSDLGLTIDKSTLQADDDTLFLRYIEFYPMYSASSGFFGAIYYGNPSYIYFNPDGSIEKAITPSGGKIDRSDLTDNINGSVYDSSIPSLSDLERINNGYDDPLRCYSQSVTFNWSDRFDSDDYYIQVRTTFRYKLNAEKAWNEVTIDTSVPTGRYSTLVDNGTFTYKYGDYASLYWVQDNNPFTDDNLDTQGNIQPIRDSIRIVKISNGSISTGAWTTFTLKNGIWETGKITDTSISDEIDIDNTGGNIPSDSDSDNPLFGFNPSDVTGIWKTFLSVVNSLLSFVGNFPSLFATVFGFLPVEYRNMIYTTFISLCVIALIKAVIS